MSRSVWKENCFKNFSVIQSAFIFIVPGRQEALNWLKESLSDAIEDFEDGSNEGIPLVPIMDYAQQAMENGEFQEMLKAFGICEPFDEQVGITGLLLIAICIHFW